MKKFIKVLALAAPLALSVNANAATFVVGAAAPGGTYTNSFTNGAGSLQSFYDSVGGHFIDHMDFSLATDSDVTITTTATATEFFINSGPAAYTLVGIGSGNPPSFMGSLLAGSYQVDFKSTTGVFDATLSVAGGDTVTAVPEPETYAMLLAGLGLIGFSARRRQA